MAYTPMEDLYNKTGSVYKLVILAAKRAVELNKGAGKLVDDVSPNEKLSTIALKEIGEGKIIFKKEKTCLPAGREKEKK